MPRNKYHDTCVVEFHEAFGAPIAWSPGVPPFDRRTLRADLLLEEVLEFAEASGLNLWLDGSKLEGTSGELAKRFTFKMATRAGTITEVADALADIRYVTDGAALEWGIPLEKCLREVHRSNMSKLGEDGRPILRADGKILKGPHFTLPDLESIIELYKGINNG
jgi:predicted HAD superfamily Cof-like phosphohydrolase